MDSAYAKRITVIPNQIKVMLDRRPVGQSVFVSVTHLGAHDQIFITVGYGFVDVELSL